MRSALTKGICNCGASRSFQSVVLPLPLWPARTKAVGLLNLAGAARASRGSKFAADDPALAAGAVPGSSHQLCRVRWVRRVGKNIDGLVGENGVFADAGFVQSFGSLAQHGTGLIGSTRAHGKACPGAGSDHRQALIQGCDAWSCSNLFQRRA